MNKTNNTTMPQLSFHKALLNDLDEINLMYKTVIVDMISNGILQWDEIYPDRETIRQDIIKGEMYIARHGNLLAAAYTLNSECDDEYKNGNWKNISEPYFIVHRLCVNPQLQKQGIGTYIMLHIEEYARNNNASSIRLDCFPENHSATALYKRLGYTRTGIATYRKGKFLLMEKML